MKFRTKREKLKLEISDVLSGTPTTNKIVSIIEGYESNNLKTIEKLRRKKIIESRRISGALRQFLNDHPVLTKELIGSATKRIYGSLLDNNVNKFRPISLRDVLIGLVLGLNVGIMIIMIIL